MNKIIEQKIIYYLLVTLSDVILSYSIFSCILLIYIILLKFYVN